MAIDSSKSILVRFFCTFELKTAVYIRYKIFIDFGDS